MSALPHIGRTARQRLRAPVHQAAPTAAERELDAAIHRARHEPLIAAPDYPPPNPPRNWRPPAAAIALLVLAAALIWRFV